MRGHPPPAPPNCGHRLVRRYSIYETHCAGKSSGWNAPKMCTCALMKGGYIIIQKGKYQNVLLLNYSAKKDVRIISLHPVVELTDELTESKPLT